MQDKLIFYSDSHSSTCLMTLRADGCFFRHNSNSLAVSDFSTSAFPHLITFVHSFYGYWNADGGEPFDSGPCHEP